MNYLLSNEITELNTYNSRAFANKNTKFKTIFGPVGRINQYSGSITREFHVKPINYIGVDGRWHPLDEIAYYFGNKGGLILKEGWEEKVDFGYLVWYLKRQHLINGKGIRIGVEQGIFKRLDLPLLLNLTLTAYPDPNPETTTVDGEAYYSSPGTDNTWATIRGNAGNTAFDSNATLDLYSSTTTTTDRFDELARAFYLFDTSSLGGGSSISAATFSIVVTGVTTQFDDKVALVLSTIASNTAVAASDYEGTNGNTTKQSDTLPLLSALDAGGTNYNDWSLNATGLTNISKTGVTKLGQKLNTDLAAAPIPTWVSNVTLSNASCRHADTAGTSTDPKLVVTYTAGGVIQRLMLMGVGS